MKRSAWIAVSLAVSMAMLVCGWPPGPEGEPPAPEVTPTSTAVPPTSPPAVPTDTPAPPPDVTAPSPIPASHTGIILANGECYDLDTGNAPYVMGPQCDVLLVHPQILRPQNGAMLSGHATLDAPSRTECESAIYEAGDLAPNTDLYICFRTNEGSYGFLVQRTDGAPFAISSQRLVFDWWLYP